MSPIDYPALLAKYIRLVLAETGDTLLSTHELRGPGYRSRFTPEEWAALKAAEGDDA